MFPCHSSNEDKTRDNYIRLTTQSVKLKSRDKGKMAMAYKNKIEKRV